MEEVQSGALAPQPERRQIGRWVRLCGAATLALFAGACIFFYRTFCIGSSCNDVPAADKAMMTITYFGTLTGLVATPALAAWAYLDRHRTPAERPVRRWAATSGVTTLTLFIAASWSELRAPDNSRTPVIWCIFLLSYPVTLALGVWDRKRRGRAQMKTLLPAGVGALAVTAALVVASVQILA